MIEQDTIRAWHRPDGRVGVRNHVIILPVDDISNAAAEGVARIISGTLALPHAYGRLQFGADLDLHFRTMIGTGANPNVAAAVVIGIEPEWTRVVADGIRETGKPVAEFSIEQNGDIATIAEAARAAKSFVHDASALPREKCALSDLWISTKCGESDTTTGLASCPTVGNMYDKLLPEGIHGCFGETSEITGAEHLCRERAATVEAAEKFMAIWQAYQDEVIEAHKTTDLSDSQPTKGNILGGLTTIEEKALGNLEKIGREARYIDALEPAEAPARGLRTVFHGYVVRCGGMRNPDGCGGICAAHIPDRAGERGWQPDRAGHQDQRQSAYHSHDERAHRPGRVRNSASRDDDRRGG